MSQAITYLKIQSRKKSNEVNKEIHRQGFLLEAEVKDSIAGRKAEPTSVDTGRFINSVSTDNSQKLQSKVYSNVPYSKFLEFGTSRMGARKHFRNSKSRRIPSITKGIKKALS